MINIRPRKSNRLGRYDYSTKGYYFVTICTQNREYIFGDIVNDEMVLNDAGRMVESVLNEIPKHYPGIGINEYVVMPTHMHCIINIHNCVGVGPRADPIKNDHRILNNGQAQGPVPTKLSLSTIIKRVKSLTTKKYIDGVNNNNWPPFVKRLWQRSFHDRIIRNDKTFYGIRKYIIDNPKNWETDENNIKITVPVGV